MLQRQTVFMADSKGNLKKNLLVKESKKKGRTIKPKTECIFVSIIENVIQNSERHLPELKQN